jgi:hypothetical protein
MVHDDLRQIRVLLSRLQDSRDSLKSFVLKLRSTPLSYKNQKVSSEDLLKRAENITKEIDRLASELDSVYKAKRVEARQEPNPPRRERKKK